MGSSGWGPSYRAEDRGPCPCLHAHARNFPLLSPHVVGHGSPAAPQAIRVAGQRVCGGPSFRPGAEASSAASGRVGNPGLRHRACAGPPGAQPSLPGRDGRCRHPTGQQETCQLAPAAGRPVRTVWLHPGPGPGRRGAGFPAVAGRGCTGYGCSTNRQGPPGRALWHTARATPPGWPRWAGTAAPRHRRWRPGCAGALPRRWQRTRPTPPGAGG